MHNVHVLKPAGNLKTLVLNTDGRPNRIISWQRAFSLVYANTVTRLNSYDGHAIKDGKGREYCVPAVVILKKYVRQRIFAPLTDRNVMVRDLFRCQYCLRDISQSRLTLDHVHPKSLGGKRQWNNLVTACLPCNRKKANRTCEEAGMFPANMPTSPAFTDLYVGINPNRIPKEWKPFITI